MATDIERIQSEINEEIRKGAEQIAVNKPIEIECDVGNLLSTDVNPHNVEKFAENNERYFKELARDNMQVLANHLWKLPIERVDNVYIAKLPATTTILPREKPIPKDKPLTKWQEFAKLKGIKKKKKERMVWDEKSKSYKPSWGYKRANDDTKEWCIEIPGNADIYEDQFEKRATAKKERIAKNDVQRMRNIARNRGKKVPGVGETLMPGKDKSKDELNKAFHHAKQSTASMGRFEPGMKGEKKEKGVKRKFDPLLKKGEKEEQMQMLKMMGKGKSGLNVAKAVGREMGHIPATTGGGKKKGGYKGGKRHKNY